MMHEERTKSFSIPPGISLINENENFIDTYSFSSSMIFQDRINILLNQSNALLEFGLNFSKKIKPIISEHLKKNSICIDNRSIQPVFSHINLDMKNKNLIASPKFSTQLHNPVFTIRQVECIYCVSHGLSSAETSLILNISKRTVESILNAAMIKAGCVNRYQLIYQSTKYGLIAEDMISPLIKLKIKQELSNKF